MARLEQAIRNIVDMFVEYADGDGNLNKEEFKKLLEKEIENPEIKVRNSAHSLYMAQLQYACTSRYDTFTCYPAS